VIIEIQYFNPSIM